MLIAALAAFACALCYGVGAVLQSVGAARTAPASAAGAGPGGSGGGGGVTEALSPSALARLAVQLPYLAGLGLDLLGWLLSLLAVRGLPLFAVQAILSGSVGVTAVLAVTTLGVRLPRREVVALAVLGAGMVLLALTARPGRAHPASSGVSWGIAAGVVVIVALIGPALRAGQGRAGTGIAGPGRAGPEAAGQAQAGRDRAGAALGLLSGLAFGGTALCARLIETRPWADVLTDPATWALLAYGGLGLALFAIALQRGAVTTAMAGQCAGETLLPALAGTLLLGDGARSGLAPLAGAGFLMAVIAAFTLITGGAGDVDTHLGAAAPGAGDAAMDNRGPDQAHSGR
ncbi:putative integral membrane protein transcription factor [Frankia canadensis]|uniref:Putative integral membrane protein transcription factor n=1 Tax=Frankia canadensis TaxID=1836972 RepID=A0A2I2L1F8_9ACTN|nr:hypothetical protein [Frankia canadensis]SNQ51766.1 putative integral membrane protein transcription factor [Frankia canadensis]SOU59056.1 putative integral membrane protein transcription factor [Frankia canadensis]